LSGFRIRSHDLYGPRPEILIKDTRDRYYVLDETKREAAKLCAMVRVREDLAGIFPGCEFLLPIRMETGSVVGLKFDGKTVFAEDRTHWEVHHMLLRKAVEAIF
jgi:hypothetical protein